MHEKEGRDERCEEARGRVWITREASELRKETRIVEEGMVAISRSDSESVTGSYSDDKRGDEPV